jgi:hypothetical protein
MQPLVALGRGPGGINPQAIIIYSQFVSMYFFKQKVFSDIHIAQMNNTSITNYLSVYIGTE